ncbi:MAG TPA: hypothetical protein VMB21_04685 [Candidatus Limnocylindria bacterium]|jgi:hypothetical protein|nr:hypothetical protein [Candidatus Limnocylindria bacterium]
MLDVLTELLALVQAFREDGVDYAVCDGLAMAVHGFTRATEDIDLLVEPESLPKVREVAARCGFRLRRSDIEFRSGARLAQVLKTSPTSEDFLLLDLMLVGDVTREAWNSRIDQPTPWGVIRVVSRDALKAMKRQAGRPQDLVDIQRMENPDDLR